MKNTLTLLLLIILIAFKGNAQTSESDFEKAIKRGVSFFMDGKIKDSQIVLLQIVDDYRKSDVEFSKDLYLGNSISEDEMNKFVEKTFYSGQANFYLGLIELSYKDPYKALNYFETSLEFDSANAEAMIGIGDCYFAMFKLPKAVQYYSYAIEIKPNAFSYSARASALSKLKEYKSAIDDLSNAINADASCLNCYHNRGYYYLQNGQYNEALKDFDKVLSFKKDNSYALNNKGMTLFKLGDTKKALALIDLSLQTDNSNYFANRNKAIIFYQQGKKDLACAELKKSIAGGLEVKYDKDVIGIQDYCK